MTIAFIHVRNALQDTNIIWMQNDGLNTNTKAKSLSNEIYKCKYTRRRTEVNRQLNEWMNRIAHAQGECVLHLVEITCPECIRRWMLFRFKCEHHILLIECGMWAESCLFSFLPAELICMCSLCAHTIQISVGCWKYSLLQNSLAL